MAGLTGQFPGNSYKQLIQFPTLNSGVSTSLQTLQDGLGNNTAFQLSTLAAQLNGDFTVTGNLSVNNVTISGTMAVSGSFTAPTIGTTTLTATTINGTNGTITTLGTTTLTSTTTNAGNLTLTANTLSSTNTNGDINFTPNGTGNIVISGAKVKLNADQPFTDSSGNNYLAFTKTTVAVNYFTIKNNSTGNDPIFSVTGSDSNINWVAQAKGTGAYLFQGSTGTPAELRIFEDPSNGTNYIGLKVAAALSANKTFILPSTDGTANQSLITNGSGTFSFASTIKSVVTQFLTSGTTYTPTSGLVYCIVIAVGGGGGGGGATSSASQAAGGGGGGGGGYAMSVFAAAAVSPSVSIAIGGAGTAGTSGGGTGGAGGNTTFGLLTANGGGGGTGATSAATAVTATGGAGGTASGGIVNISGQSGNEGLGLTAASNIVAISGSGGSSGGAMGMGGGNKHAGAGTAGTGFGGGGAGGAAAGATSSAGGAGSAGCILVIEYLN